MKITKLIVLLPIIIGLSACSSNKNHESENNVLATTASELTAKSDDITIIPPLDESVLDTERRITLWQEAYVELLQKYEKCNPMLFFVLYDFDKSGTPELIVMGEYDGDIYESVYSFRDGNVVSLTYDESVSIAGYALSARAGIYATLDSSLGLITYLIGPTAGLFGTSAWYTLVVIDEDMLLVSSHGNRYVDVDALHKLFDDFGWNTDDLAALHTAIQQQTFCYLNDKIVTEDEFYRTFEMGEKLLPSRISTSNIQEVVYSFSNP